MGDMGDMYRGWNELRKKQKESNTIKAMNWLQSNKIDFESRNYGSHLIILVDGRKLDFWPSTNKAKIGNSIVGNALDVIKKIHRVCCK